jgi:hypothetical protein
VRATTAFKRLMDLPGVTVADVDFQPAKVVVRVRLRRSKLSGPAGGAWRFGPTSVGSTARPMESSTVRRLSRGSTTPDTEGSGHSGPGLQVPRAELVRRIADQLAALDARHPGRRRPSPPLLARRHAIGRI